MGEWELSVSLVFYRSQGVFLKQLSAMSMLQPAAPLVQPPPPARIRECPVAQGGLLRQMIVEAKYNVFYLITL